MKKITVIAVAAIALTMGQTRVSAMTEAWGAAVDTFLTLTGGTTGVPAGGRLEIGILGSNTVNSLQALQDNPAGLEAAFVDWASSTIGTGTDVDGSFTITSTAPGAGFFNQQIYILAFNNGTPANATQVGLFTNPAWLFPATDPASANTAEFSTAGLAAIIGVLTSGTVTTPEDLAGGNAAQLHTVVAVPEPSTMALVGLGLLGAAIVRRRKKA